MPNTCPIVWGLAKSEEEGCSRCNRKTAHRVGCLCNWQQTGGLKDSQITHSDIRQLPNPVTNRSGAGTEIPFSA